MRLLHQDLNTPEVILVSNREPFSHEWLNNGAVTINTSAGGLLTALDPVMQVCAGTWIAHGSGTADRHFVDSRQRVVRSHDRMSYSLRRVWLSNYELKHYRDGFANEGLWALCHDANVAPVFRRSDWAAYQRVNAKFSDAITDEAASRAPMVLVQDYHLALIPRTLRSKLPEARIGLFWHVPWPRRAVLRCCPWRENLMEDMLHADVLGFSTPESQENFLESVRPRWRIKDGSSGARVYVNGSHYCQIRVFPISIAWSPAALQNTPWSKLSRAEIRASYSASIGEYMGLGVDRWDFTKGIVQRLQAFELYLRQDASRKETLTLLQVAVPSRCALLAYKQIQHDTRQLVNRINKRFATKRWNPVILIERQLTPEAIFALYRAADFCIVNSLHDGMNLVAKEFVAARKDEDGVLILSERAGSACELKDALLVQPLDIAGTAQAIERAITMPRAERRYRMRRMRHVVRNNTIYRWAAALLTELAGPTLHQRRKMSASASRP